MGTAPTTIEPPTGQPGLTLRAGPAIGTGIAHGTFGELLQGKLPGADNHFLVTLPIRQYSRAIFTPGADAGRITVAPAGKAKSLELVRKLADHYGFGCGGQLSLDSELPEGKGMASSSADMVAAARALEASLGHPIPTDTILALLRSIEPSDGVMYPEFVTFFHRRVDLGRRLGFPSPLMVLAMDEGGQVDTIEYNRRPHVFTDNECAEYADLLQAMETAVRTDDLTVLGQVATRSAVLNQARNPKRHLPAMLDIQRQTGALGVVVTHSGPCIGLLYPRQPRDSRQVRQAETRLAELTDRVFCVESLTAPSQPDKAGAPLQTADTEAIN